MLFLLFKVTGVEVRMEEPTSAGRIDMVVRTDKYVYVMEFKLNQSADKAMRQITDKHYADSYLGGPQQVFRIGVNFAEETKNIADWTIEKG
jgi:ATP-dependent exoDNAse (exonuclease V) beta subunit